jgi:purine-binding chemotaxis protein CheW
MDGSDGSQGSWLLCRAGPHLCALPLADTLEVMRMQPAEPLADAPAVLRGVAVIRGAPVPLLDLGRLLGQARTTPSRIVTVRTGARTLGLAVAEVQGVRRDDELGPRSPLPLLSEAAADSVAAIGTLDGEALLFLERLRVLAEKVAT